MGTNDPSVKPVKNLTSGEGGGGHGRGGAGAAQPWSGILFRMGSKPGRSGCGYSSAKSPRMSTNSAFPRTSSSSFSGAMLYFSLRRRSLGDFKSLTANSN